MFLETCEGISGQPMINLGRVKFSAFARLFDVPELALGLDEQQPLLGELADL